MLYDPTPKRVEHMFTATANIVQSLTTSTWVQICYNFWYVFVII